MDGDGTLDLVVNNLNAPALILKNKAKEQKQNNYLTVKLEGEAKNTEGIGAKVTIYTGAGMQFMEMQPTRGFESSVDYPLHFGLGKVTTVDSLVVVWRDGKKEKVENVKANQSIQLSQKNATTIHTAKGTLNGVLKQPTFFTEVDSRDILGTVSKRNFNNDNFDTDREKLLPHFLCAGGPKISVGDLNGDGLEDFFMGNDNIYLQSKEGRFKRFERPVFGKSVIPYAASAIFDADGDGDLDIYAVNGLDIQSSAQDSINSIFTDGLFLNDGKGNFTKSENSLPKFIHKGSCAKAADFDGDGGIDLFVGSRSDFKGYGVSPKSSLLHNDGKGHFTDVTAAIAPELEYFGMVTDALWTDINGDGKPDLIVVGEWTPIAIFLNQNGKLIKQEIPHTSGWWNCIAVADLNGDGKPDLIAGNLGLNSNLQASQQEPLGLYLKDFDNNGTIDPILTYYRQGQEWCYASKDELTAQMPFLKKRFSDYMPFANSPFNKVFPQAMLKGATVKKAELMASVWLDNKGNGQWETHLLPPEAQFSTVQAILPGDFDGDGKPDLLIGGNFYEMIPSIGRMDASYGSFLKGDGKGGFAPMHFQKSGWALRGSIKDIQKVGKYVVSSANEGWLQIFQKM